MAHAKPEASEEGLTATSALLSAGRQRSAKERSLKFQPLISLHPRPEALAGPSGELFKKHLDDACESGTPLDLALRYRPKNKRKETKK